MKKKEKNLYTHKSQKNRIKNKRTNKPETFEKNTKMLKETYCLLRKKIIMTNIKKIPVIMVDKYVNE